jgi:D-Tyr-tRNAtyr deacylase
MTQAEYEAMGTQIATGTDKMAEYDRLQEKIDNAKIFEGNVYQVGGVTVGGEVLKLSDPELIAAFETKVSEYIAAKEAEQAAI